MKIIILALILLTGCSEIPVKQETQTDNILQGQTIDVKILDCNGLKLYSEKLPLIYVQQQRQILTNANGDFVFCFDIPSDWDILFESETMSFSAIGTDSIRLNFLTNTYYQIAITTESK